MLTNSLLKKVVISLVVYFISGYSYSFAQSAGKTAASAILQGAAGFSQSYGQALEQQQQQQAAYQTAVGQILLQAYQRQAAEQQQLLLQQQQEQALLEQQKLIELKIKQEKWNALKIWQQALSGNP